MSDVSLLSGISGLSFDSLYLFPLLVFGLVLLLCLSCLFFFSAVMVDSTVCMCLCFSENVPTFFVETRFFIWLLLSGYDIIVGRRYVQLAAI